MNESIPVNPLSGVYVIPSSVPLITAVPEDGVVTEVMLSESPSASVSLARTSRSTSGVSNCVVNESSFATGGLLTFTSTIAVSATPSSSIKYENWSTPIVVRVYVTVLLALITTKPPFCGVVT